MERALSPYVRPNLPVRISPPAAVDPRIADVEVVARWLDYAFVLPGGFRFGLAGIVGLIPGLGDVVDALVSLYIVVRAIQLGVARVAITRMLVNVGIEAICGSVPLIGDLFDVVFKANKRNYQLLQNHMSNPRKQRSGDWLFLIALLAILGVSIALPLFALLELAKHV